MKKPELFGGFPTLYTNEKCMIVQVLPGNTAGKYPCVYISKVFQHFSHALLLGGFRICGQ